MAVFVSDTFTETSDTDLTSHTGETGASWTLANGYSDSPVVNGANDVCMSGDSASAAAYASGEPATAEYDVEADVKNLWYRSGGITGRHQTGANTYYMLRAHNSKFELYKVVNGSFSLLGQDTTTLTYGQEYSIKLEIRDATKKAYVDGVEKLSSTDNAITAAGRAGIRFSTSGSLSQIDNFTATDAGGSILPILLSGSGDAATNIIGDLKVRKSLSGQLAAASVTAGLINIRKSLSGNLNAAGFIDGALTVSGTVTLAGGLSALSGMSGALSVKKSLSGSAEASADIAGAIMIDAAGRVGMAGNLEAMSTIQGALSIRKGLSGTIQANTDINGDIHLKVSMSGSANAVADLAGNLRVIGESSLGVIIDPSIESETVQRILKSITVERTIESI